MIVPKTDEDNLERIGAEGFMSLDELVTQRMGAPEEERPVEPTPLRRPEADAVSQAGGSLAGSGLLD